MTTNLSLLTNAQLLLRIVSVERECPVCEGTGSLGVDLPAGDSQGNLPAAREMCNNCANTGKVPILAPTLMRLPCPNQDGFWSEQFKAHCVSYLKGHSICTYCQGRNWLPNPDAWAMKKALHQAKLQLLENQGRSKDFQAGCFPQGHGKPLYPIGGYVWDADPERARYLAVVEALGIS